MTDDAPNQVRKSRRRLVDEGALLALACGATVESAARQAGLSSATIHRRLRDPKFRARLQTLRDEMVQRTAGMLTAAASEAVKTLLSLQAASTPATIRLGAARAILEIGIKIREVAELTERVAALEAQLTTTNPTPTSPPVPPALAA